MHKQISNPRPPHRCNNWVLKPHTRNVRKRDDIDRISTLSDYLIGDILSFLPTKDAVATSVLSRRWRHVFTWITRLDFDDAPICPCLSHRRRTESFTSFKMFVENVLQTCQSNKVTSFSLKFGESKPDHILWQRRCGEGCFPKLEDMHLSAWISFSLTRGVRQLDLCAYVRKPAKLPLALFGCQTLKVLKLYLNHKLELPMSFCLPNLKVFHFGFLDFPESDFVTRLVSSCPCLEDISLTGECWKADMPVNILAHSLRSLFVQIADTNDGQRGDFVLETPNLEFLQYSDIFSERYSIRDLNALVEASADIVCVVDSGGPEPILSLIRSLSNARDLHLSFGLMEVMQCCDLLKHKLPLFHYLKHLRLGFDQFNLWHQVLLELLNFSPLLETLSFPEHCRLHMESNMTGLLQILGRWLRWNLSTGVQFKQSHLV